MKKISVLTIALVLFSCNSEDDSPNSDSNLVGVWKMENNIVLSGTDKVTVLKEYIPDNCKKQSTYEFTNNGKYITNDFNNIGSDCVKSSDTRDYIYNAQNKTITIGQGQITADIMELTEKNLIFIVPDNYDYNNDGIDDYLKYIFYK